MRWIFNMEKPVDACWREGCYVLVPICDENIGLCVECLADLRHLSPV